MASITRERSELVPDGVDPAMTSGVRIQNQASTVRPERSAAGQASRVGYVAIIGVSAILVLSRQAYVFARPQFIWEETGGYWLPTFTSGLASLFETWPVGYLTITSRLAFLIARLGSLPGWRLGGRRSLRRRARALGAGLQRTLLPGDSSTRDAVGDHGRQAAQIGRAPSGWRTARLVNALLHPASIAGHSVGRQRSLHWWPRRVHGPGLAAGLDGGMASLKMRQAEYVQGLLEE